jgi:hypothetical protein
VFRFVETRNGKPVKDVAVSHRVTELGRLGGVKLMMESLRRGFGCYWASRVATQVLQKLMRHSNIRITMDYYANIDDAAMRAVLGRQPNSSYNTKADEPAMQEVEEAAKDERNGACGNLPNPLLVGIRFLPEILAAQIEFRRCLNGTIAVHFHLASQPHFVFVTDAGEHGERMRVEVESLHKRLGTKVFHALFDQHFAGAA